METHGARFAVSSSCDRADLDGAGKDEDIFKGDIRQPQIIREETNGGASAPSSIEATSTSDSGFASGSVAAENNVSSSCASASREDNGSKRRTSKVATQETSPVSEGDAGFRRSKRNQCRNNRTSGTDESKSRRRMAAKQKAPAILEDDASPGLGRHRRGHTEGVPGQCDYCEAFFADKSAFDRHMCKKFTCVLCGAYFPDTDQLVAHLKAH
nr:zinc finger protein 574-like isoform X3 [Dermacentor andersoni]